MNTSIVTVRLDSDDKNTFACMCKSLGLSTSTAFNMFVKDCIKKQSILGLQCDAEPVDENGFTQSELKYLMQSIAQLDQGKLVKYEQEQGKE